MRLRAKDARTQVLEITNIAIAPTCDLRTEHMHAACGHRFNDITARMAVRVAGTGRNDGGRG